METEAGVIEVLTWILVLSALVTSANVALGVRSVVIARRMRRLAKQERERRSDGPG
jgi:hypothetical protein